MSLLLVAVVVLNNPVGHLTFLVDTLFRVKRHSKNISPEDFSTSYRRICLDDFSGSEGEWIPNGMKIDVKSRLPLPTQEHKIRAVHAITALGDEIDLIDLNLIVVGGLFNEFLCELFPVERMSSGLEEIRQTIARKSPNSSFFKNEDSARVLCTIDLVEKVLGKLDYMDNDDFAFIGRHFEKFFGDLDPNDVKILSTMR